MGQPTRTPGDLVYRVGWGEDPWRWPDWSRALDDRTFGNRYDDPAGSYRVLYGSTQRVAAFVETLAFARRDGTLEKDLAEIEGEPGDYEPATAGVVSLAWVATHTIGSAVVKGEYFDVGSSEGLALLRREIPHVVEHFDVPDLDAAAIRLHTPRGFTQAISRHVYEVSTPDLAMPAYAGIRFLSRHGDDFENWAVFEPAAGEAPFTVINRDAIRPDDGEFLEACRLLGLVLQEPARRFR